MARGKRSNSKKCQSYLQSGTRIYNKTRKLKKRIVTLPEVTQTKILKNCKIGRAKEKHVTM